MTTTVSDFMRKKIETIEESAKKMKEKNVSSLLVVDKNGNSKGLITERDLVRKACINDIPLSTVTNRELMSSPLITIDSKESPSIAADLMLQNNIFENVDVDKNNIEKILEYYL